MFVRIQVSVNIQDTVTVSSSTTVAFAHRGSLHFKFIDIVTRGPAAGPLTDLCDLRHRSKLSWIVPSMFRASCKVHVRDQTKSKTTASKCPLTRHPTNFSRFHEPFNGTNSAPWQMHKDPGASCHTSQQHKWTLGATSLRSRIHL